MHQLADVYIDMDRQSEAIPLLEETVKLRKEKLGRENFHTLNSMQRLAFAYRMAGRLDEGVALMEEVLQIAKTKLVPDHLEHDHRHQRPGGILHGDRPAGFGSSRARERLCSC